MKALMIITALTFSNFLYAFISGNINYMTAFERSYFQAVAVLIAAYAF